MDGAGCCEVASEATSLDPRGELVKTEVRGGPSIERELKDDQADAVHHRASLHLKPKRV